MTANSKLLSNKVLVPAAVIAVTAVFLTGMLAVYPTVAAVGQSMNTTTTTMTPGYGRQLPNRSSYFLLSLSQRSACHLRKPWHPKALNLESHIQNPICKLL